MQYVELILYFRANYFWDGYKWAVWGCVDGFQIEDGKNNIHNKFII